jgi:general secretion pathway protein G
LPREHDEWALRDPEAGVTILEIMIVLVILSLIAVVGTIQIGNVMDRAKVDVARLQLRQIESSLEVFRIDVHRYPTDEEGLAFLLPAENEPEGWRGPYLKSAEVLLDPWGQRIVYSAPEAGGFRILSFGSDRREGGEGAAADIVMSVES